MTFKGDSYTGASILATTRPLTDDTGINFGQFTKTVSIKGFNREQIERIIDEHFKGHQDPRMGERMKEKLFEGNQVYQQLVSCPLLCQLFCFLFDKDERFPEKVTEVYYRLIQCLIRKVINLIYSLHRCHIKLNILIQLFENGFNF